MATMLYGYWRSSAAYRVRIALHLKGIRYTQVPVHLVEGAQRDAAYAQKNPMRLVPTLEIDGHTLIQSPAILEYLEETRPHPSLLPQDAAQRAVARAVAMIIGCDTHPIANLSVLSYLKTEMHQPQDAVDRFYRHWNDRGLSAVEQVIAPLAGTYCVGDRLSLADIYLAPQLYNARRFGVDLSAMPTLVAIDARLNRLPAFIDAQPERQPDAPAP